METNNFITRQYCPGCKSTNFTELYSCGFTENPVKEYLQNFYASQGELEFEYLQSAKFILDECLECGLVYHRQIPDEFLSEKLYEQWLDPEKEFQEYQLNRQLDYFAALAEEIMVLIDYFNRSPSQIKVFDFGMGWGNLPRMANAFGCEAYGNELSTSRENYASSYGVKPIKWDQIPDYEFDYISTEQVFEHLPEPLETLAHLAKAMSPDGLIKISVPDGSTIKRNLQVLDWSAEKDSKYSLNPVSPLEHLNCFNHGALIKLAEQVNLEMVKLPLISQYTYSTNWRPFRALVKNLIRPVYRNTIQRSTRLFFRHAQ
jgi:2-polyprenyl-3-methyl-5-hydroxy-6-metoxy-1,4-benzoquinol methylase